MAERNALAELSESMKRKVGDFSADESFKATLENANSPEEKKAAAFFQEYALASRIVAELAKVGEWFIETANKPGNDGKVGCHYFKTRCYLAFKECRAIAEEGAEDGAKPL